MYPWGMVSRIAVIATIPYVKFVALLDERICTTYSYSLLYQPYKPLTPFKIARNSLITTICYCS